MTTALFVTLMVFAFLMGGVIGYLKGWNVGDRRSM